MCVHGIIDAHGCSDQPVIARPSSEKKKKACMVGFELNLGPNKYVITVVVAKSTIDTTAV